MNVQDVFATVIVSDMGKAVQFYTETLGFKIIPERSDNNYSTIHTGHSTIWLVNEAVRGQHPGSCESPSIAIQVDSAEGAMQELKNKGVEFTSDIIGEGPYFKLAFFKDLDGNLLYVISAQFPHPPA